MDDSQPDSATGEEHRDRGDAGEFGPGAVETVTVDSYGTLVDTDAVRAELADHVPEDAVRSVSQLWRARSLLYTMVCNGIGAYEPFYELNRSAMEYALAAHGIDLPAEARESILAQYHALDVFEDVRAGLARLVEAGYEVTVVSNGDPEMLASMVEHAGLGDVLADTVSADEVRTFKPRPEVYRHAAARTGTPVDRILHVAAPSFDVLGAKHAGMRAAWLDRGDGPWEPFAGVDPDLVATDLHDVADALGA